MRGASPPRDPATTGQTGRTGGAAWLLGAALSFALAGVLVLLALSTVLSGATSDTASGATSDTASGAMSDTASGPAAAAATDPAARAGSAEATATPGPDTDAGFSVWAVNDDGLPIRWDPCRPIEVVLSTVGAPTSADRDLDEALARLSAASGLELVRTGTTNERPSAARPPYQPERYRQRWAPILVAWAAPGEAGLPLRDTDRGVSIPVAGGPAGDRTFLTAQVILNRDRADLVPGFGDRADAWGATLLHELLHALGLDHVDDPDQLMATYPGSGPVALGTGDQAGLDVIGATHGCRSVPEPGPLRVIPPPPSLPGRP